MGSRAGSRVGARQLATRVGKTLRGAELRLVTAESCTGGWLAQEITAIAGSSAWFDRGFIAYSDESKQEMLGVQGGTLAVHGAVSEAVVREMALGALARSRAHFSVAVSGIAGPTGGTAHKPVGTVCMCWASIDCPAHSHTAHYRGNRRAVRQQAVIAALTGLLQHLGAIGQEGSLGGAD